MSNFAKLIESKNIWHLAIWQKKCFVNSNIQELRFLKIAQLFTYVSFCNERKSEKIERKFKTQNLSSTGFFRNSGKAHLQETQQKIALRSTALWYTIHPKCEKVKKGLTKF